MAGKPSIKGLPGIDISRAVWEGSWICPPGGCWFMACVFAIPRAWLGCPLRRPWEVPSPHPPPGVEGLVVFIKAAPALFPPLNVGSCLVSGELSGRMLQWDVFCL